MIRSQYIFSSHGNERFQSRGFTKEIFDFIQFFATPEYVGDDTFRYSLTKKELKNLLHSKKVCKKTKQFIKENFERLTKKVVLIVKGIIVRTVYNRN